MGEDLGNHGGMLDGSDDLRYRTGGAFHLRGLSAEQVPGLLPGTLDHMTDLPVDPVPRATEQWSRRRFLLY